MRLIGLLLYFFTAATAYSQSKPIPAWFLKSYKHKGLDEKYVITPFLKPAFQLADFNGDNSQDIVSPITNKATNQKGLLIIHSKTNEHFIFGAGRSFGDGGQDFNWIDRWSLYLKKVASETRFDKVSGDILGSKSVKLARPSLLVESYEDGAVIAGAIIYWDGRKYVWIHQGE